jgi:hypothetical protein
MFQNCPGMGWYNYARFEFGKYLPNLKNGVKRKMDAAKETRRASGAGSFCETCAGWGFYY